MLEPVRAKLFPSIDTCCPTDIGDGDFPEADNAERKLTSAVCRNILPIPDLRKCSIFAASAQRTDSLDLCRDPHIQFWDWKKNCSTLTFLVTVW